MKKRIGKISTSGFFYSIGIEFLIKRPIAPNICGKLMAKIDDYGDIRLKDQQEVIEIVQKLWEAEGKGKK